MYLESSHMRQDIINSGCCTGVANNMLQCECGASEDCETEAATWISAIHV